MWIGRFMAMGGPCEVLAEVAREIEARAIFATVASCARRIDEKFSRYRPDNIVARINRSADEPVEVDDETGNLLDFAGMLHRLSDGLFDITSGVLRRAWTFDGGDRLPARAEIDALLPLVGWAKLTWSRPFLRLRAGMEIDFGGIGKEYAVDQAIQQAAQSSDAAVLVNFGGDLAVTRARSGGRPWRVGIEAIDAAQGCTAKRVDLMEGGLATSGDTYRFLESRGSRLPHVLDPRDGRPVRGAPRSVTVAAATCTHAGALSTLAMLRGPGAEAFLACEEAQHWVLRDA